MRQLAKPGAVLLIDDLDEGPGPALQRAEREHIVKVLERRMFNRSRVGDPDNPCIRRVRRPLWNCKSRWGWAAARYLHTRKGLHAAKRNGEQPHISAASRRA